jgi:predicted nucleic acid-binding protein
VTLVLVDTSVWVRALHRAAHAALRQSLDRLLDEERVARHAFVYGELLVGNRGGRRAMLTRYLTCPDLPPVSHDGVVAFVQARALAGRGLSWIDCHLLAAAVRYRVAVWSTDAALQGAARELGVGADF